MKNKLTKIGVSALCGSLAAVASAQAGSMSVSGTATATWTKQSQTSNGNPIGINTGLTFVGTGELDNGTAITYTLTHADKAAYSVGSIALATPSIGTISISHASGGNGLGGYDDKMPTAWEETWGNGVGTSINHAKGVGSSTNIQWASPTMFGSTIKLAYAPRNDGQQANDKAGTAGAGSNGFKGGVDLVIDMKPIEGFNLWVGGSRSDKETHQNGPLEDRDDHEEVNIGGIFNIGPVALGFAKSAEFTGLQAAGDTEYYVNTMYGLSFNVNDDLSLSYGNFDSKKRKVQPGNSADVEVESWQIAYSMGGAAMKLAKTDSKNSGYTTAATGDKDAVVLALSLAF